MAKPTKAQLRYLAEFGDMALQRRAYSPPAKRIYPKLAELGFIEAVRTVGIGKSAVTYYSLTAEGFAAIAPT